MVPLYRGIISNRTLFGCWNTVNGSPVFHLVIFDEVPKGYSYRFISSFSGRSPLCTEMLLPIFHSSFVASLLFSF